MRVVDLMYIVTDIYGNVEIFEDSDDAKQFIIQKEFYNITQNMNKSDVETIKFFFENISGDELLEYFIENKEYDIIGKEINGGVR